MSAELLDAKNEQQIRETAEQREKRIAEGWTTPAEDKALSLEKDRRREGVLIRNAVAQNFSPEAAEIVELGMNDFEGSEAAGTATNEARQFIRRIEGVIQGNQGRVAIDIIGKNKHGEAISKAEEKDIDQFVTEVHKLLGANGNRVKPYIDEETKKVVLPENGSGIVTSYGPAEGLSNGEITPDSYSVRELTPTGLVITEDYEDYIFRAGESEKRTVKKQIIVEKFSPDRAEHGSLKRKLEARREAIVQELQGLHASHGSNDQEKMSIGVLEAELKIIDSLLPASEVAEEEKLAA